MTNRILFAALLGFFLLVLLAPSASFASPVDTSAADQALIEGSFAVGLVGSVVLGVYALLAAFRNVREALGVGGSGGGDGGSLDLAPHVRGFVDQQSYLDDLAARLAAEDAERGIDFRDVETGKTNLDYMHESGLAAEQIDRSQHSQAELDAYDKGLEQRSMSSSDWDDGSDSGADFDPLTGSVDAVYSENLDFAPGALSEDASSGAAVDYGSAAQDYAAGVVEFAAAARAEAQEAGADMALYDKFIAEEDTTHDEALRWSLEAATGDIRLPALPVAPAFDHNVPSSFNDAQWFSYQAGLTGAEVDKSGWSDDQYLTYDTGRDAAHEAYLNSQGTSSAEVRAARGKD